jgi:hypothetical protein
MLGYHQGSEALWFAECDDVASLDAQAMLTERWCAAGVLLGAALSSRCGNALNLSFSAVLLRLLLLPPEPSPSSPQLLMQQLCKNSVTEAMSVLQSYDPSIAAMALLILNEDGQGLSDEDYLTMLDLESLQHAPRMITREQYVQQMVRTVVLEPVEMQLAALRAGLYSALPHQWLTRLAVTPTELHIMLGGSINGAVAGEDGVQGNFSWRSVFQVVEDPELVDGCPTLRGAFWNVMEDLLSPTEKRQVLAFVTGINRPPAARSGELLRIEMPFTFFGEEKQVAWGTLPQAHTCSNTLELPNYYEAWQWRRQYERQCRQDDGSSQARGAGTKEGEHDDPTVEELSALIRDRLLLAVHGSQGYTLDEL